MSNSAAGNGEISYDVVNSFIISIKCQQFLVYGSALEQVHKYLKQYGSSIVNRLETQSRQPALYVAAVLIDHEQSYEIMRILLEHGANPFFKDNNNQTVLFYVCREGKEKCLDMLLERGLSLDDEDIYGQTCLFYVAKENRLNIIHKLIEKKVDVGHIDKLAGHTALFYAAREGHLEMCKILVEAGCDVSIQDVHHKNAAHYAKKFNNNDVNEYLTNEIQMLRDQKKIGESKGLESNHEERNNKKGKRREPVSSAPARATYRLFRADNLGNANELSAQEFEELMENYPEVHEMLLKPEEIDLSSLEEIKAKEAWVKIAQKVLNICWKSKGSYFFQEPVDPVKYNINDYFEIIDEPMDMGTVKRKLNHNVYHDVNEYIRDMKLVFDNCVKYNGAENSVAKFAIDIKNTFEENMKQTGFMN